MRPRLIRPASAGVAVRAAILAGLSAIGGAASGPDLAAQRPGTYVAEWVVARIVVVPDSLFGTTILLHSSFSWAHAGGAFDPDSLTRWARDIRQHLDRGSRPPGGTIAVAGACDGWMALHFEPGGVRLEVKDQRAGAFSAPARSADQVMALVSGVEAAAALSRLRPTETGLLADNWSHAYPASPERGNAPAEIRRIPKPEYPVALQRAGEEGIAWLRYVIDSSGRVANGSMEVLWASHRRFGEAAAAAVRRGAFVPARVNGQPTATLVIQAATFRIAK